MQHSSQRIRQAEGNTKTILGGSAGREVQGEVSVEDPALQGWAVLSRLELDFSLHAPHPHQVISCSPNKQPYTAALALRCEWKLILLLRRIWELGRQDVQFDFTFVILEFRQGQEFMSVFARVM